MGGTVELPDIEHITLVLEDCRLVVVTVKVVWAREEGHNGWEARRPRLSIHPIAKIAARISVFEEDHQLWLNHTQHLGLHAL